MYYTYIKCRELNFSLILVHKREVDISRENCSDSFNIFKPKIYVQPEPSLHINQIWASSYEPKLNLVPSKL